MRDPRVSFAVWGMMARHGQTAQRGCFANNSGTDTVPKATRAAAVLSTGVAL
jgi:hypothetical protein